MRRPLPQAGPGLAAGVGLALALVLGGPPARAQAPAPMPAPADSLSRFLEGLHDSTDAWFGEPTVAFDTTGLDTLVAGALSRPPLPMRRPGRASTYPVLGFHRALGATVGAGHRRGSPSFGVLDLRGSYATKAKLGRYAFAWRRTLWSPGGPLPSFLALRPGRIGERTRLDFDARYARENLAFMPEHADPDYGAFGALLSGSGAQSIYEARGASAGLTLWTGDWRLGAGVRDAREKPLPVTTRFSLLGEEADVAANTQAEPDRFTEPYANVAFFRRDWELGGVVHARGGGGDRWRLRSALGKSLRLGKHLKLTTQVEAGAAAARAPRQRRFELGGALAIPSLPYGRGGTDHLLLGRSELVASPDVLAALGVPHPAWLVLQPSLFVDYGNAWDDAAGRDVVLSSPPGAGWRGAAGGGFAWKLGVPEPDVTMRLWMSWPLGPRSGVAQFNMSVGRTFELLGRL
jgi:hypothetical protein